MVRCFQFHAELSLRPVGFMLESMTVQMGVSILALVLTAAFTPGCGSSSGGTASGSCDGGCWQPTPADQAFVASFCALTEACCVQNAYRAQPDIAGCTSKLIKAGFTSDSTVQQTCLAELQTLSASTSCVPELWQLSDACVRVFNEPSGPQQPGQLCKTNADCAGVPGQVTYCTTDPSQLSPPRSFCIQLAPGQSGDHTCFGNMDTDGVIVAAAFYRANAGVPPLTTGVVCQRRSGFYCAFTDDPLTRACAMLLPDGANCSSDSTCASGACTGAGGTCAPRVAAGQTCQSLGVPAVCDDASYCKNNGTGTQTCVPKLPPGSDCSGAGDAACTTGRCPSSNNVCSAQTHAEGIALLAFCVGVL